MRFNEGRPIFEQIAEMLEGRILSRDLNDGERIPSARDLGASLQVNPNTAARALQVLSDSEIARCERGAGYFVAPGAADRIRTARRERFFAEELPQLFERMEALGVTLADLSAAWTKHADAPHEGGDE